MTSPAQSKTAAILVIGDEILSGRTKDKNIGWIAEQLNEMGIDLVEARVIADVEETIISHVTTLSESYDYVFTSGGIGPTHDDITTGWGQGFPGIACTVIPKLFDVSLRIMKVRYLLTKRGRKWQIFQKGRR